MTSKEETKKAKLGESNYIKLKIYASKETIESDETEYRTKDIICKAYIW
jgi:hypothetical protein